MPLGILFHRSKPPGADGLAFEQLPQALAALGREAQVPDVLQRAAALGRQIENGMQAPVPAEVLPGEVHVCSTCMCVVHHSV